MTAPEVARHAYDALMAGKTMAIAGLRNKLVLQSLRLSPRRAVRAVSARLNQVPQRRGSLT